MTTTSVCFTVDGEWLADFARTRYTEGNWDRALAMLTDSLEGLSTDQAIAILRGRGDLTGDSSVGVAFVELSDSHEKAKLADERDQYMFRNLFRVGNKIYRPYAVVSGWDKSDYNYSCTDPTIKTQGVDDRRINGAARSMYYAHNPSRDLLVQIPTRLVSDRLIADVLCEEYENTVPFWINLSTNDAVNFVKSVLDRQALPVYGAASHTACITELEHVEGQSQSTVPETALDTAVEQKMNKEHKRELLQQAVAALRQVVESPQTSATDVRHAETLFERVVDATHSGASDELWEEVDAIRNQADQRYMALLRQDIVAQANVHGGFFDLDVDGNVLKVPKNPFVLWALRGPFQSELIDFAAHGHTRPVWQPISKSGEKMAGDDPYHTDWVIGAGLTPAQGYDDRLTSAAYNLRYKLVERFTGHHFVTLAGGNQRHIFGEVHHPQPNEAVPPGSIAIIPHAGPEYQLAMESANKPSPLTGQRGCVVCNVGGKLAHLAVVGREISATVLMLPNATNMYAPGRRVTIDMVDGLIAITS